MTQTPRTDAAANDSIVKVYETSKQLERELAEARVQRDTLAEALEKFRGQFDCHECTGTAESALDAVKGDKP
jgi:hypothetical protein